MIYLNAVHALTQNKEEIFDIRLMQHESTRRYLNTLRIVTVRLIDRSPDFTNAGMLLFVYVMLLSHRVPDSTW